VSIIITFIIILLIIGFLVSSSGDNSSNEDEKVLVNGNVDYTGINQTSKADSPIKGERANNKDLWLNLGGKSSSFFSVGDTVKIREDKVYKITKLNGNGNYSGINQKTNEEVKSFTIHKKNYVFINGIYINKRFADVNPKQSELKMDKEQREQFTKNVPKSKQKIDVKLRLSGVTFEGRQETISNLNIDDKIYLRRDYTNPYDNNAIGVYVEKNNKSLGWVPRDIAANLAPIMDQGIKLEALIHHLYGGNGYNFGIEIVISNEEKTLNSYRKTRKSDFISSNSQKKYDSNKANIPEYLYLDQVLLRRADKSSSEDVHNVLVDFINYRDKVLPMLNIESFNLIQISDLVNLFDNTIMLAGGTESNFVHRHYKTLLIQLSFQLGFLLVRVLPESSSAIYAKNKMDWLSTMDVRLETRMLQSFFDKNVVILGDAPRITDTDVSNKVYFWDISEIKFVLENLTLLGFKFNEYIQSA